MIDYFEYFRPIINKIEKAKTNGNIANCCGSQSYGKPAFWFFFGSQSLIPREFHKSQQRSIKTIDINQTLKNFVSNDCNGDIDSAIVQIKDFRSDTNETDELFFYFDGLHEFLRHVKTVLAWSKKPGNKRNVNFLYHGFCCCCHRIQFRDSYYCELHQASFGNSAEIKRAERVINNSFDRLKLTDTPGLNREEKFKARCLRLEGWAKHRPEHLHYNSEIDKICGKYPAFKKSSEIWDSSLSPMFQEIKALSLKTNHTAGFFARNLALPQNPYELKTELISKVFYTIGTENKPHSLSPYTSIIMLCGMSIFSLIKMASTTKGINNLKANPCPHCCHPQKEYPFIQRVK